MFEVPEFVSGSEHEMIGYMIRAEAEERIQMQQIILHQKFYHGPAYGQSINIVKSPLELLCRKRLEIAEMIVPMTTYQLNLHFNFADTGKPHSAPDE